MRDVGQTGVAIELTVKYVRLRPLRAAEAEVTLGWQLDDSAEQECPELAGFGRRP